MADFRTRAEALREEMVARRRDFHQHPELAFEEFRTAGIVAQELNELGLEVQTGVGKTGVVAILEGQAAGPTVLVRCDMDALPILEANQTDYASQTTNKMHACGHDGHTTIGLAVAKMLHEQRQNLKGRIKFVFQPAEEIGQGAVAMIEDGVLNDPKPEVSLGLHLWNSLPVGNVALTAGPAMAASGILKIELQGKGGHAASPHMAHDPVVTAAHIITALQTIVSRNVDPLDTAVVSITQVIAGDAHNVIPHTATLLGTVRAFKPEVWSFVEERITTLAESIASAMGCAAKVSLVQNTPPLINDPEITARLKERFVQLAPELTYLDHERTMGGEDMAYFLQKAPGLYFFVGSANEERDLHYPHHHPRFDFDEEALVIGASLLASAVADYVLAE